MMSSEKPADAAAEIARLKGEIEALRAAATDKVEHATRRAEAVAREVESIACDSSERIVAMVRERPLAALLIAGVAGFVVGRLAR